MMGRIAAFGRYLYSSPLSIQLHRRIGVIIIKSLSFQSTQDKKNTANTSIILSRPYFAFRDVFSIIFFLWRSDCFLLLHSSLLWSVVDWRDSFKL